MQPLKQRGPSYSFSFYVHLRTESRLKCVLRLHQLRIIFHSELSFILSLNEQL